MTSLPAKTEARRLPERLLRAVVACMVFVACLATHRASGSDVVITEPQVKALCLLNFAKYVTWPANAFEGTNSPIRIVVVGDEQIHRELDRAAKGKSVLGRPVEVVAFRADVPSSCHLVFISDAEKSRGSELLKNLAGKPVVMVGDSDEFVARGGTIMFVKRDNKVRFEVNLAAARRAQVQISSKLLSLADAVRGKE